MLSMEQFAQDTLSCLQNCAYRKLVIDDMRLQLYGLRFIGETLFQSRAHRHDFCEFFYVAGGFFATVANGKQYVYHTGQYGILAAGVQHYHPVNTVKGFAIRFQIRRNDALTDSACDSTRLIRILHKIQPTPMTDDNGTLWEMFGRILERGNTECLPTELMLMLAQFLLCTIQRYAAQERVSVSDENDAKEANIVNAAMNYLQTHCTERIAPQDVAEHVHFSYSHLARLFAKHGYSGLHSQILIARVDRAQNLLLTTDMSVTEIADAVGFRHVSHFSQVFLKLAGVTATEYRLTYANKKDGVDTML